MGCGGVHVSVQGQEQHLHAGLPADVAKTSPYYCQCKTNCGVSTTLCTMIDLEVKARLRHWRYYVKRSATRLAWRAKVNRKAWPITKAVVTTGGNTGKGKLVTDGNGKPQTGVGKKGVLRKTASHRLPLTEGNGQKKGELTCHGRQRTMVAKKTTENLRTENRKKKITEKILRKKIPAATSTPNGATRWHQVEFDVVHDTKVGPYLF